MISIPKFRLLQYQCFIAVLWLFSGLSIGAQNPQISPSVPPPNWTRSHNFDVQHYRLNLSFDWKQKMVMGDTTITFRPFESNFKEVEFDAGDMSIKSVSLIGKNSGSKPLTFKYDGKEKLRVNLDQAYGPAHEISINIAYSATPKKGMTFIMPNDDDPKRPYQIWTQGEAETNHYWFPCYDYPNDRASSETFVTVEDNYQVISNGVLVDVKKDPAKKTATYHWKMDQPYSSYLASVIVGEFAEIKQEYAGIPITSYVPKDKVSDGRISLGRIDKMVQFFSEKTGVKYPYPKYAQTTVRDFGGGMENISATTLGDFSIHDARAHIDLGSGNDDLQAHELAHQWFGDFVTCRDWSEIWLNESFATYFANLYTEYSEGRDAMLYAVLGNQKQYFMVWNQGQRRPIVNNRYDDPDSVFDTYAYPRGGAVLHMLRTVLGDEAWWKSIHHYLTTNSLKNVETTQLKIAIEEATGQNLGWFFDEWVLKMGHPEFEVGYTYDEAAKTVKLKVKQTQKVPEKSPYPVVEVFRMPVDIGLTTSSGERIEKIQIDRAEQEFSFSVDSKPLIVNFDRGNTLIKTLKFEKPREELLYQAANDKDVMGRIWAINELKLKKDDAVIARGLGEVLAKDSFWGVKVEAAKALAGFPAEQAKPALLAGIKDQKSSVRREIITALAQFKDQGLADLFIGIIGSDTSYYAVAEAEKALGATGSNKAFEVLKSASNMPSDRDVIRAGALSGLGSLGDPRAIEIVIKSAASPNPENVKAAALQAAIKLSKGNDSVREQVFQLLLSALKGSSLQMKFTAIGALGQFGDQRAIAPLESLASDDAALGPAAPFFKQLIQGTITQLKSPNKNKEETKPKN